MRQPDRHAQPLRQAITIDRANNHAQALQGVEHFHTRIIRISGLEQHEIAVRGHVFQSQELQAAFNLLKTFEVNFIGFLQKFGVVYRRFRGDQGQ